MDELEVEGILAMDCDDFEVLLKEEGIDIDVDSHTNLHKQMAEIDGTGTSTDILDAMEQKLHMCYKFYDDWD